MLSNVTSINNSTPTCFISPSFLSPYLSLYVPHLYFFAFSLYLPRSWPICGRISCKHRTRSRLFPKVATAPVPLTLRIGCHGFASHHHLSTSLSHLFLGIWEKSHNIYINQSSSSIQICRFDLVVRLVCLLTAYFHVFVCMPLNFICLVFVSFCLCVCTCIMLTLLCTGGAGPIHEGVCSGWLNTCTMGETVPCTVRA